MGGSYVMLQEEVYGVCAHDHCKPQWRAYNENYITDK